MSHPMCNPFAGKQIPPQAPYGIAGGQMERDPRRPLSHLGSGSSIGSSGSSSLNRGPSGGHIPSLLSLQINCKPENRSKVPVNEDMNKHLGLQIGKGREQAMQNTASQNSQFPKVQIDSFPSPNVGMPLYSTSAGTPVNRPSSVNRGRTSFDWASGKELSKKHPSASSGFGGSGDGAVQAFPSLGNYVPSVLDKSAPSWEASHPMYTSESAVNILQHFGLQKEDLDHLTLYPEDQITPENLPFILRKIQMDKKQRASTSGQPRPYSEAQPIRSVSEMDPMVSPRGPVLGPDQVTSTVVKQSKVIDYGHTSKSELSSFGPHPMSKVPQTYPSKTPALPHYPSRKPQPSSACCNLIRGAHPQRPGLVLFSNDPKDDQRRSTGQPMKATKKKKVSKTNSGQTQQLQMCDPKGHPAPPTPGPSQMDVRNPARPSSRLPAPALMEDYGGAPRIFPHTCTLCNKNINFMKDWVAHENSRLHYENRRLLRERYPEWNGSIKEYLSTQPGQNLRNQHQRSVNENESRSLSPRRQSGSEDSKETQGRRDKQYSPLIPYSPQHHHGSESRRSRQSSRSQSPQTSRHARRPSPHNYDQQRSRSRSYERRSPPRRTEAKQSSPRRSYECRSSPGRSHEKRSSLRGSHERWSPAERSVPQRKRSRSVERLAKRLLEKPVVQSLSKQSDLEAMVKTLAPVLLAELANLKSSTSAASSSSSLWTERTSTKSSKPTSSRPKGRASTTAKAAAAGSMYLSTVNLSSVFSSISHTDMVEAMEKIGKVKSVVLYRNTLKACVSFEKEEDATKLLNFRSYKVKGRPICVDRPGEITSKKPLLTKQQVQERMFGTSKSQTAKLSSTGTLKKPLSYERKNTTSGRLVTKAKVLVSKAKNASTKQVTKTVNKAGVNGNGAGKSAGLKRAAYMVPKSMKKKKPASVPVKKTVRNTKPGKDDVKSKEAPKKASESKTTAVGKMSTSKSPMTFKTPSANQKNKVSPSESTNEDWKSKTDSVERQKQQPKKTNAQKGSVQTGSCKSSMTPSEKPQTSSSVSHTPKGLVAEPATATSAGGLGKHPPEVPHKDDDNKDVSTEAQKHRMTKEVTPESKNKESGARSTTSSEAAKQENTRRTNDENKDECVSLGRFDELDFSSEDFVTVDQVNEDLKNLPLSSQPTTREEKESSGAPQTSTRSTPSLSKTLVESSSSCHTSSPAGKQKSFSEPKKSETRSSSFSSYSSSSSSKSVKTLSSSGQNAQSNKMKTSSASSVHSSLVDTQQERKPTENTKATTDHHVAAENCPAKRTKTSDENQTAERRSPETDVKDGTIKEMKNSEDREEKNKTDGKNTEKRGSIDNKQTPKSPNEKSDEQIKHVTENLNKDKAQSDKCHDMEIDESTKLQDHKLKDQVAASDDGDEGLTVIKDSDKDETEERLSVRGTDRNQMTSEDTKQTPAASDVATNGKTMVDMLLPEDDCGNSKDVSQISKEDQPLENNNSKDTVEEDKLEVPIDLLSKGEVEPKNEDVYHAMDSADQVTTTEAALETENKESMRTSGDERPSNKAHSRSRKSKSEENKKSPKQQDNTVGKVATRTKESNTEEGENSVVDSEGMVYEVVDSTQDDTPQKTSTTENSSRRRTTRGNKKDENTSTSVEELGKEEEMFPVVDSVEEKSPSDKPLVTRSARGRRAKKVEENIPTKEDKTPTRRRRTPVRDSKEQVGEKTSKMDVCVPTPTKKDDAVSTNTSDGDASFEQVDAIRDDQPTTQRPRRGRPRKHNKTTKKQTNKEEESDYQILDSLGDQETNATVASSVQKERGTENKIAANVDMVSSLTGDLLPAIGKEDDNIQGAEENPPAEGSEKKSTPKTGSKKEEESSINEPNNDVHTFEKKKESPKTNNTTMATDVLINLHQVCAEGGNNPDAPTKTEKEQEYRRMTEGAESEKMQNNENNNMDVATNKFVIPHEKEKEVTETLIYNRETSEQGPQEVVGGNLIAEMEDDRQETFDGRQSMDPLKPESLSGQDPNDDDKAHEENTTQTSSSSKRKNDDNEDVEERKQKLSGPKAKRSRSQSPSVPTDFLLPPFNPESPLGEEFIVPKSGFFCNLCSIFYLNESTAKRIHCSSQKHYDNLQKHYKKLQWKTSGTA